MASVNPLALRFPKPHHRLFNVKTSWNTETIGGKVNLKSDMTESILIAPRKFSDVAKVNLWVAIYNASVTTDFVGRLRIWTPSAANDPEQPDTGTVAAGGALHLPDAFTISAIVDRRFAKGGALTTIPHSRSSGSVTILQIEFDIFEALSSDFFTAWNVPTGVDELIQFQFSLELEAGSSTDIQLFSWGIVPIQAPSPVNNTVTYIPVWPGQFNAPASGPATFDRAIAPTHDQIRGAWRWLYDATQWDKIEGIYLWLYWGGGSNDTSLFYEISRLTSESQASGSTTVIHSGSVPLGANQKYGVARSANLLPLISDGDAICADWSHETFTTSVGGVPARSALMLEVVQRDCTKTVTVVPVGVAVSRALTGVAGGDAIPSCYSNHCLIDPRWFANFPDSLFTARKGVAGIVHDNSSVGPQFEMQANSDLNADQNGPPGDCLTPTTSEVDTYNATPTDDFPRWAYQEKDIRGVDPINLAGQRQLFARIDGSWIAGNNDHPGNLMLKYAHAVPNREILDLGPIFPIGEFDPEGCAATSAGLGDPGILVITNGSALPKKFDPVAGKIEDAGIPTPFKGEVPSTNVVNSPFSPSGGIVPGVYEYRYTFRNCCTGKESDPNPDTFIIDSSGAAPAAEHQISFANVRIPADPQICEICLYRTVAGGNFPVMAKVGCFNIDETSVFIDTTPDSLLDFTADPLSLLNAPMPCVSVVVEYRNRLFGFGDIPLLAPTGTVSVVNGSNVITGDEDVLWDRCLEGKFIKVGTDCRVYEIDCVLPPVAGVSPAIGRLQLLEDYEGETDTGLSYTICGRQNRVYFSEPLEPECWPAINFIDVEPGDGDRLMGGASNFDSLVICKRSKTYILRFRENPLLEVNVPQRISTDIGCIAPRSIAQVENGTVWLSDRGIALFDGRGVQHIPASDRFNDMLINPDNPNYVRRDGQGRVIDAVGVFYPKREQYLLLLPTVQTVRGANVMLVWDTSLDNITLFEFCQEFQAMVVAKDADGDQRVYLGDTNGFVWMFDVGDTDGVGFPNATGTVRGIVGAADIEFGASFLEDPTATFVTGGLPQLAALSGVQGLTPAFGQSPNESGDLGIAGVCVFTRAADADLDDPWTARVVYASTQTKLYVTPSWGTDTPSPGDDYMIGAIDFRAVFKPTNYGTDDDQKRNWQQVVTFAPQAASSRLRIELLPDFTESDDEELTVRNSEDETGEGRVFDMQFSKGRVTRPVGRRIHNFMRVRMTNFAPDEPIEVLNHALRATPRTQ